MKHNSKKILKLYLVFVLIVILFVPLLSLPKTVSAGYLGASGTFVIPTSTSTSGFSPNSYNRMLQTYVFPNGERLLFWPYGGWTGNFYALYDVNNTLIESGNLNVPENYATNDWYGWSSFHFAGIKVLTSDGMAVQLYGYTQDNTTGTLLKTINRGTTYGAIYGDPTNMINQMSTGTVPFGTGYYRNPFKNANMMTVGYGLYDGSNAYGDPICYGAKVTWFNTATRNITPYWSPSVCGDSGNQVFVNNQGNVSGESLLGSSSPSIIVYKNRLVSVSDAGVRHTGGWGYPTFYLSAYSPVSDYYSGQPVPGFASPDSGSQQIKWTDTTSPTFFYREQANGTWYSDYGNTLSFFSTKLGKIFIVKQRGWAVFDPESAAITTQGTWGALDSIGIHNVVPLPDGSFMAMKGLNYQMLYPEGKAPSLTVSNVNGSMYSNVSGYSAINVSGFTSSDMGDAITVSATLSGITKKTVFTSGTTTQSRAFNIPFDVITDAIPTGSHTVTIIASANGFTVTKTFTITVISPVTNGAYVILGETLDYSSLGLFYSDIETDAEIGRQWKYDHDSSYFENPNGTLSDSNTFRSSYYTQLPYTGKYTLSARTQDDPSKGFAVLNEFRKWSSESLNKLILYVHRRPVANFTANVYTNDTGGFVVQVNDTSYDLDKQSNASSGIVESSWSWKLTSATEYTIGFPPETIPSNESFFLQLQVKDQQGAWSIPKIANFTTTGAAPLPQPPVATMTTPNGTQSSPTILTTTTPTFNWTQTSPIDGMVFKQFQIQVTNYANTITLYDSGAQVQNTSATTKSFTLPSSLPTGQAMRVRVRVADSNVVWSNWSTQTWLYINNPPTGNLMVSPSAIYEYDNAIITINPIDPDGDPLNVLVESSFNGGAYSTIYTANGIASGAAQTCTITDISKGNYTVRLTLTDPSGASFVTTRTFSVLDLNLTGDVLHTTDWEVNRQDYNAAHSSSPRSYDTFWAGEQFDLSAIVTTTGTATIPTSVTSTLLNTGDVASLWSSDNVNWSGSLWDLTYDQLDDGVYTFRFEVTWNNGNIETYNVDITIDNKMYAFFVTQLRN